MKAHEDYAKDVIDKQTFIAVLELVQPFAFRRFVVGLQTNALGGIFMSLHDRVEPENYLPSVQKSLLARTGTKRFPKNAETASALKEKDVYNIQSKNRTYLLERLENHQNNEPVVIDGNPGMTLEHIFPQNPDPTWKAELGADEYTFIKETYLNTIGNLTLSGNNEKLDDKSSAEKQSMNEDGKEQGYKYSHMWINRYLQTVSKWDRTAIEGRANVMAERFLNVWAFSNIEREKDCGHGEINIFDAEAPTSKKLEYAVFLDQKLEVSQVTHLYTKVFKHLFDMQPETFFISEIGDRISLTKNPRTGNLRAPVPLSDTYFMETNLDSNSKFERIKQALTIFGLEDELTIKYAD